MGNEAIISTNFQELELPFRFHKDSKNKMDGYIGFGTDLKYGLFSAFGTNGYISLNIPLLFAWRGDDAGHNVMSMFSDPSVILIIQFKSIKKRYCYERKLCIYKSTRPLAMAKRYWVR